MTFKINDRVKVKIADGVEMCGKIIEISQLTYTPSHLILFQNGSYNWIYKDKISHITDPMDCLMVGDILVNKDTLGQIIIKGVCGDVYFISRENDFEMISSGHTTISELKMYGWKVKTSSKEDEVQQAIDLLKKEGYEIKK